MVDRATAGALPDRALVVAGVPRSGTSLMRDLLGSHPSVAMFPGELPFWRVIAARFAGLDVGRPDVRARLVDAIVSHPRMRQAGVELDAAAILRALAAEPPLTASAVFAHAMRQYARGAGRERWGLKDPLTELEGDRILADLPHATIVHMVRDPRDVLASQRGMWGRRAQHVVSTVDAWRRSAALARRQSRARVRGYLAVRYEDLVMDAPAVARRVCEAAGLDYAPEMLERAARPSWWVQSSEPALRGRRDIFREAVARHERQLGPADVGFIQLRAGAEMARWGYAPRGGRLAPGDRAGIALRLVQEAAWRVVRAFRGPRAMAGAEPARGEREPAGARRPGA